MPSRKRAYPSVSAGDADIARTAAIFADPARAAMLTTLLDGQPHAISELARCADIALSTASEHVARLRSIGYVETQRRGRMNLVLLVQHDVVTAMEAIARIAPRVPVSSLRGDERRRSLERARLCYDHLAGELGVELFASLTRQGALRTIAIPKNSRKVHAGLGAVTLGPRAKCTFKALDIDLDEVRCSHRQFATACVDWTHGRPHLAGALGSSLRERFERTRWVERTHETRSLRITPAGRRALARLFAIDL
ncbi:MAG: ArsR/SmtB family transcription factor [Vulcanimicrobiaceae bacterium]